MTSFFTRGLAALGSLRPRRRPATERKPRHSLTLVSAGSSLNGSIDAPGGLRVEGRLQGDVRVQGALEVLKEASIIGTEVHCRDLLVAGLIEADVYAAGSVTIVSGGRVHGDLHCRDLQAPRGAQLQGRVTLGDLPAEAGNQGRQPSGPGLEARASAADAIA